MPSDDELFLRATDAKLTTGEAEAFAQRLREDAGFAAEWLRFLRDEAILREAVPALRHARQVREQTTAGSAGRGFFRFPALISHRRLTSGLGPGRLWPFLAAAAVAAVLAGILSWSNLWTGRQINSLEIIQAGRDAAILREGKGTVVRAGQRLLPGDILTTGKDGGAQLRRGGEWTLDLAADSSLDLPRDRGAREADQPLLEHGRLQVRATGAHPVALQTLQTQLSATDAEWLVTAEANRTDLRVSHGEVQATRLADRAAAVVRAGESLRIAAFGRLLPTPLAKPSRQPQRLVWRIGRDDLSREEFGETVPAAYEIPADWAQRENWKDFGWRLNAHAPLCELGFVLAQVPKYGVEFSFRTLNTSGENGGIPTALAVFANGALAGLPQTWKAERLANDPVEFRVIYRVTIPPEMLQAGRNELRLQLAPHPYSESRDRLEIEWDYLALAELLAPADEPLHGRYISLGTYADHASNAFCIDADLVRHMPDLLKWMGIAYCGNTMRVTFWDDRARTQPARREYLEMLRDYNMGVLISGHGSDAYFRDIYRNFGGLAQYHEIASSPEWIGDHTLAEMIQSAETARRVREETPAAAHLRIVGPGWAFRKWGADAAVRRQVEDLCDAVNGHDFGDSYAFEFGGHFIGTLRSYGGTVDDGLPREWLSTECGTENGNLSPEGFIPTNSKRSSSFDRNMRAHLAVTDRAMQHAMFMVAKQPRVFNCSLFAPIDDWSTHDPADTAADAPLDAAGTRLKIFRRLALAYATHGRPLPYVILDPEATRYHKVYVRAVDTLALPPLAGSGAHADKVLLCFVNFEERAETIRVRVQLPLAGVYVGERIGPGDRYRDAVSAVSMESTPAAELSVSLPAGESVEYILTRP